MGDGRRLSIFSSTNEDDITTLKRVQIEETYVKFGDSLYFDKISERNLYSQLYTPSNNFVSAEFVSYDFNSK